MPPKNPYQVEIIKVLHELGKATRKEIQERLDDDFKEKYKLDRRDSFCVKMTLMSKNGYVKKKYGRVDNRHIWWGTHPQVYELKPYATKLVEEGLI